jgi:ADP-ribosylglycohydrolase
VNLRDRFGAALVGGAIGDAMGRANEGRPAREARARKIREYLPWAGWHGGPKGTITDDTQMTIWLAEAILDEVQRAMEAGVADTPGHLVNPDDLAQRFTREEIRGIGQESLPCALWCFLVSPEDFEQILFTAVDAGHDADTVAAMACTVAGAFQGHARLPQRLVADLEFHDRLLDLADGLYALHARLYGPSWALSGLPARSGRGGRPRDHPGVHTARELRADHRPGGGRALSP